MSKKRFGIQNNRYRNNRKIIFHYFVVVAIDAVVVSHIRLFPYNTALYVCTIYFHTYYTAYRRYVVAVSEFLQPVVIISEREIKSFVLWL